MIYIQISRDLVGFLERFGTNWFFFLTITTQPPDGFPTTHNNGGHGVAKKTAKTLGRSRTSW